MAEAKVNTFFISEKISKIRWIPEKLHQSEKFLTGSWENATNFVRIWRLQNSEYSEFNEYTPKCCDKISFKADVTGMEFATDDTVVVSTTDGHISAVKIKRAVEEDSIQIQAKSPLLHKIDADGREAPCTGISVYGTEVATVGEDGRLNILGTNELHMVRRTINADSCSLTSVAYINPQEVLTANRMGVIRMFDVRAAEESTPTISFMTSCEDDKRSNFVSCLASHPTQPHIVLAGSEEGSITVWDLRQPGLPASYLSAHNSPITEIGFHRREPSKLFTAAENGELWLWVQLPTMDIAPNSLEPQQIDNINPWLNGERAKSRINVTSLISNLRKSINCFDSNGSNVICGSETEAIYFIDNIF